MSHDELAELAARTYVYGFPLVFDLEQVDRVSRQGMGSLAAAPFNEFAHATQLAGPQDTFVSVNNDTVYSIAQLDVSGGPVRLRVPDADGRYYVLSSSTRGRTTSPTSGIAPRAPRPAPICSSRPAPTRRRGRARP